MREGTPLLRSALKFHYIRETAHCLDDPTQRRGDARGAEKVTRTIYTTSSMLLLLSRTQDLPRLSQIDSSLAGKWRERIVSDRVCHTEELSG